MQLSLKTLNGRFIWVNMIFIVTLASISLYSHHAVEDSADNSVAYIRKSQLLNQRLNALTNQLEHTEILLQQYSTFLRRDQSKKILDTLGALQQQASSLHADSEILITNNLRETSTQLLQQTNKLVAIIKQYLSIMQNVDSRYSAMPILLTYLEPTNQKFSEAVEQALQGTIPTDSNSRAIQKTRFDIVQLFQQARYDWAMQISWFRIFVANRMGAFGDPIASMHNNLINRNMFAKNVKTTLGRLKQYDNKGLLDLQQHESLHQMYLAMQQYDQHLKKALKIYLSPNWRADVPLLRNSLQPALEKFWQTLHKMQVDIADLNKTGLARSQSTASMLSYFIWLYTGFILLMLLFAYKVFQNKIRKPLLILADNMQSEQTEKTALARSKVGIDEINRLINAYSEMRKQVDNRQQRLQSILDNAAESIITIDNEGFIENFNKAASQLFQYLPKEAIGRQFSILFPENNSPINFDMLMSPNTTEDTNYSIPEKQETIGQRRDGTQFHLSLKFSELDIGNQRLYTVIVDDISERLAVMNHLRHIAEHDSLTNLHNRQYFNDAMERSFAMAKRNPEYRFACIYIDLDNFKYINDTLGHVEGDRLLVGIANTLKSRTRKTDVLARLGGDEFALLLFDLDKQQAALVAENYRNAIANFAFVAGGKYIDTGCSIGVALFELDIENKEGLLSRADIACHTAKRNGRNRIHTFEHIDKDRIESFHEEMGWARRIRYALEHDDFVFACQPMLQVNTGTIYSHELLLRMRDPETRQYIRPGGFLDSAERFGLMPDIDRWVIEHVFEWINEENSLNPSELCYFVNLSGKSIGDASLLKYIKQMRRTLEIAPQRIIFEITEDVAIADLEQAQHFLRELRQLGFKTALDDFGVGYSSFAYLRGLDVDFVKIDGSFITSMHSDELNFALVKAINNICHILGKKTVAEFVQNDRALKLLKEIGVDFAQGYNIASAEDYDQPTIQFRIA